MSIAVIKEIFKVGVMKKIITIIALCISTYAFSKSKNLSELRKCKSEVKSLRPIYVHSQIFESHYLLKLTIYPEIEYWAQKNFNYRPWLVERGLERKLKVCKELLRDFRIHVGEPNGVNSDQRGQAKVNILKTQPNDKVKTSGQKVYQK